MRISPLPKIYALLKMKTIEERAEEFVKRLTIWCNKDKDADNIVSSSKDVFRNVYMIGATDEHNLIISELNEVMNRLMLDTKDKAEIIKALED